MSQIRQSFRIGLETGRNHYSAFHCGQSWLCLHSEEQQVLTITCVVFVDYCLPFCLFFICHLPQLPCVNNLIDYTIGTLVFFTTSIDLCLQLDYFKTSSSVLFHSEQGNQYRTDMIIVLIKENNI
jgi:hypothetical protein